MPRTPSPRSSAPRTFQARHTNCGGPPPGEEPAEDVGQRADQDDPAQEEQQRLPELDQDLAPSRAPRARPGRATTGVAHAGRRARARGVKRQRPRPRAPPEAGGRMAMPDDVPPPAAGGAPCRDDASLAGRAPVAPPRSRRRPRPPAAGAAPPPRRPRARTRWSRAPRRSARASRRPPRGSARRSPRAPRRWASGPTEAGKETKPAVDKVARQRQGLRRVALGRA